MKIIKISTTLNLFGQFKFINNIRLWKPHGIKAGREQPHVKFSQVLFQNIFSRASVLSNYQAVISSIPEMVVPDFLLDSVDYTKNMSSPRFIKTHLPFDLLPKQLRTEEKKAKIIYFYS